ERYNGMEERESRYAHTPMAHTAIHTSTHCLPLPHLPSIHWSCAKIQLLCLTLRRVSESQWYNEPVTLKHTQQHSIAPELSFQSFHSTSTSKAFIAPEHQNTKAPKLYHPPHFRANAIYSRLTFSVQITPLLPVIRF